MKYFFIFLTIITKNGNLIPSVAAGSAGQVIYVDWTFDPINSRTFDCMSSSCSRLTWPLTTVIIFQENHKTKRKLPTNKVQTPKQKHVNHIIFSCFHPDTLDRYQFFDKIVLQEKCQKYSFQVTFNNIQSLHVTRPSNHSHF